MWVWARVFGTSFGTGTGMKCVTFFGASFGQNFGKFSSVLWFMFWCKLMWHFYEFFVSFGMFFLSLSSWFFSGLPVNGYQRPNCFFARDIYIFSASIGPTFESRPTGWKPQIRKFESPLSLAQRAHSDLATRSRAANVAIKVSAILTGWVLVNGAFWKFCMLDSKIAIRIFWLLK